MKPLALPPMEASSCKQGNDPGSDRDRALTVAFAEANHKEHLRYTSKYHGSVCVNRKVVTRLATRYVYRDRCYVLRVEK